MTDKTSPILWKSEDGSALLHWCEGCDEGHAIQIPRWQFNGDMLSPTFNPSVRHFYPAQDERPEKTFCHHFIKAGNIEYCSDCDHQFSGQVRPLTAIPQEYGFR